MDCKTAQLSIHHYFDGDLSNKELPFLKAHLFSCVNCRKVFDETERTEALLTHYFQVKTIPSTLEQKLCERFQTQRRPKGLRYRSFAFAGLALSSVIMMSLFKEKSELVVRGNHLDLVRIEGNTVIVPSRSVIKGNLTVENGKTNIQGTVRGDVTVVDGTVSLASSAAITGQKKEIKHMHEWLWYKISHMFP